MRSPGRRLAELLFLVLVTGTLWFAASYASPCRTLPNAVRRRHCKYKLQLPRERPVCLAPLHACRRDAALIA